MSREFAAKTVLLLPCVLFHGTNAAAQPTHEPATVRIGVLSLFHPHTLVVTAPVAVTLLLDGSPQILDAHHAAAFRSAAAGLVVDVNGQSFPARIVTIPAGSVTLTVPEKLVRSYRGALTITARDHILIPVIAMDTELAVASIVAAESPPHAPIEALKAQAVASRSFLLAAHHVHQDFDACDTTHCQYLRSPPLAGSAATAAARATRGLVLTWQATPSTAPSIVPAMYSRSCGGQTRVPKQTRAGDYPFYSVRCDFCRRNPELWLRPPGTPSTVTEEERLAYNRTHGWAAIPSGTHTLVTDGLSGRGTGHGVGLCQLGAVDLAARGATSERILGLYFPNTTLTFLR